MKVIKELTGYSGSTVLLIQDHDHLRVRKINNIDRNLERLSALRHLTINFPKIITTSHNYYDMEYIHHSDMVTWLLNNPIDHYIEWLLDTIDILKQNAVDFNWFDTYKAKLAAPGLMPFWNHFNFTSDQLLNSLPKILPKSYYHGDFTVENCIFGNDGKFYLIDPITTEYSSWIFDIAKLQQDLISGWFIRNQDIKIQGKLWDINSAILRKYPQADSKALLILMLLRVLPYTQNIKDQQFLIKEINRQWIS